MLFRSSRFSAELTSATHESGTSRTPTPSAGADIPPPVHEAMSPLSDSDSPRSEAGTVPEAAGTLSEEAHAQSVVDDSQVLAAQHEPSVTCDDSDTTSHEVIESTDDVTPEVPSFGNTYRANRKISQDFEGSFEDLVAINSPEQQASVLRCGLSMNMYMYWVLIVFLSSDFLTGQ